jgi:hypothetical protein
MTQTAAATETKRIIFRCKLKACKHVWAHDYQVIRKNSSSSRYHEVVYFFRDADGKRITSSDDYYTGCPNCHTKHIDGNVVKGTYSESHKCDARCMNAKGQDCECSCAGASHGINWLR